MLRCPDCDREFERALWIDCGDNFWMCPDCDGVFSLAEMGASENEIVLMEFDPDDLI